MNTHSFYKLREFCKITKDKHLPGQRMHSGLCLLAIVAIVLGAYTPTSAAQPARMRPPAAVTEEDFFYAFGQKIPVAVAQDQLGILAAEGATASQLKNLTSQFGLQLANQFEEGIFIYRLPEQPTRGELVKLAQQVRARGQGMVANAGLVVTPSGAEAPMLASDQFIAQFQPGTPPEAIDDFNRSLGVEVVMPNPFVPNHFLLTVTEASPLDALAMANLYQENSQLVTYAHPDFVKVVVYRETIPDDPLFANQWHHRNTGASGGTADADVDTSQAWDINQGASATVIAVIDSGFDMAHPDLTPNLWQNPGEMANGADDDGNVYVDDLNGWDFTACAVAIAPAGCGDSDPSPAPAGTVRESVRAHGTSVAGLAAARGNNTLGVSGSCPNCRLMLIRRPTNDFAEGLAFDYARTMGAHIITNSWGYAIGTPCTTNVCTAINNAATNGRGGLGSVVFFAMNNANLNDCLGAFPDISSLDTVIGVSRSSNRDRFDFSGFGNCMDLLAPTAGTGGTGTLWSTTTDMTGAAGYNNTVISGCPSVEPAPPPANARDYTFCFNGTSSSTPLTAGVAGLILSANPGLTRLQVQQLLQDTTDKVEDSAGAYSSVTGFSTPASGQATHGWGRVNAFEAVRVTAPVAQGGKGGVDIFFRDNRLDWGNTEQPSNMLFEPTRGGIAHWESMDIKVDAGPDYGPAPTAATFDGFVDETPSAVPGDVNRVYVRVRNRGSVNADSVRVKLHWTQFGTALAALPADFWTVFPADSADTSQWHPLNCAGTTSSTCDVTNLAYSGSSVAGTAADAAQIVQFDFPAPPVDPALPNHFCLLAMVDSAQDPISTSSRASRVADFITPTDNNVTHRNYHELSTTRDRSFTDRFFVRNPSKKTVQTVLRLNAPKGWQIAMDKFAFNQPFTLGPGQQVLVTVQIFLPATGLSGDVRIIQEQVQPKLILGGLTYHFQPRAAGAPDLVTHLAGPEEVGAGEDFGAAVSLKVENQGTAPAPGTIAADGSVNSNGYMVDLVLSTDTTVPPGFASYSANFHEDVLLRGGRASRTRDLNPSDVLPLPIGATIPVDTPPGDYFLCAQVDPGGVVAESEEGNNVTCYPIRIP